MGKREGILIKIDSFLCKTKNLMIDLNDFFHPSVKRKLKENIKLIDNQNDICFVIGNGPSLKKVDLSLIKDYPSITVNGFYLADTGYKSKYHLLIDPDYKNEKWWSHLYSLKEKNSNAICIVNKKISTVVRDIIGDNFKTFEILVDHCQSGEKIENDLTRQITGSINVVPVAIECAMYMGYKRICLLGCDFSLYTQVKGLHYYENEEEFVEDGNKNNILENNVGNLIRCALVHKQHYCIEKLAKRNGVHIFNATEGSLIDAYDFINLTDFLTLIKKDISTNEKEKH